MESNVDTLKTESENEQRSAELKKLHTEWVKLHTESFKLIAEAHKMQTEAKWYPVIAATAFVGALLGLTKFILH